MDRVGLDSAVTRRIITVLVVAAMCWPVFSGRDGLPLSTYPMYAGTRSDVVPLVAATARAADGGTRALSMREIAETRDPLIAQAFLNDAISTGRVGDVCIEIIERVRDSVRTIEIAIETHDTVARTRGEPSLVDRQVVVECSASEP